MKNVFKIDADIKGSKRINTPFITQNDAVSFVVSVFDGGKEIVLSDAVAFSLASTRIDGEVVVVAGEQTGVNTVTFDIGTTETELVGAVKAVAQLYGADGRVSTVSFSYGVMKDPVGDGYIPSEREKTLIETVLGDGPLVIADARQATEDAELAATYAREQGDYVVDKKPLIDKFTDEQTSLQTQLDTIVIEGDSSVEAAQARVDEVGVAHATLKARIDDGMNSVNQHLAQKAKQSDLEITKYDVSDLKITKASKTEVDFKISQVQSGVKGTYATLTDLETALPNGDTGNYVLQSDGNIYNWDNSSWIDTGIIYQAVGVADGSVAPNKTTFFRHETTRNLFGGEWSASGTRGLTDYVAVLPNTIYTVSFTGVNVSSYYINYYNSGKVVEGTKKPSTQPTVSFTTGANVHFVRFETYKNTSNLEELMPTTTQLELGSLATEYIPNIIHFMENKYIEKQPVAIDNVVFSKKTRNLFNGAWSATGTAGSTDLINVTQATYTVSFFGVDVTSYYVRFYDEYKTQTREVPSYQPSITFTPQENEVYVRFRTFKNTANPEELKPISTQLELGEEATSYIHYGYILDNQYYDNEFIDSNIDNKIEESFATNTPNTFVKSIAHRGIGQPETTIHAYKRAKERGFEYGEGDVQWTSDNVPVMFHDESIDAKSNGTGEIVDHTLAELKALDFGSWHDGKYAGTKILTFKEWLVLCKKLNLKPYADLKYVVDTTKAEILVNTSKSVGMLPQITWLGGFATIDNIRAQDSKARVGVATYTADDSMINQIASRNSHGAPAFLNIDYNKVDQTLSDKCAEKGIELECWSDSAIIPESVFINLAGFNVTGFTTDRLNVGKVLLDSVMT